MGKYRILVDNNFNLYAYSGHEEIVLGVVIIQVPIYARNKKEAIEKFNAKFKIVPYPDKSGFWLERKSD